MICNFVLKLFYLIDQSFIIFLFLLLHLFKESLENRKEHIDQESIQLPNTFRPRHQTERRTHLKQRHHNQNTTSRKPKGQFLSQKWPNGYPKKKKKKKKKKKNNKKQQHENIHVKTFNDRNSKTTAEAPPWNGQQSFKPEPS